MAGSDKDTTTWEETLALIEMEPEAWIRIATVLNDGSWQVRAMEITSGVVPPGWQARNWAYPAAWFIAMTAPGTDVAGWFREGKVVVDEQEITLPSSEGSPQIRWDRMASNEQTWLEPSAWPSTEAELPSHGESQNEPRDPLLAEGAPTFITFYAAAASFFRFRRQPSSGMVNPIVVYRHIDRSGRIVRVRIADDKVEVEIEGDKIDGLTVELAGDEPGPSERVTAHGQPTTTVELPLHGGPPSGAWVVLKSGTLWVDRRFLTHPYQRGADTGVEWVVEPLTRLEAFLAGRERVGVEFKREVPRSDDSKLRMMKTVAAFANGAGGSILIGVDDDREIVGIQSAKVDNIFNQLTEMVGRWVTPPPPHSFEEMFVGDDGERSVIELIIGQGNHLYGAGKPAETPLVYARPYSTTERAWPSEIEDIVRARQGGQVANWMNGGM